MTYAVRPLSGIALQRQEYPSVIPTASSPFSPAYTTVASARCGLRRLRTETAPARNERTESSRRVSEKLAKYAEEIAAAIRERNNRESHFLLSRISALWNDSFELMLREERASVPGGSLWKPGLKLIGNGVFDEAAAYLLALEKNPEAISRCNEGFKKIDSGIENLFAGLEDDCFISGFDYQSILFMLHRLIRGVFETAVGNRNNAISDLKAGLRLFDDFYNPENLEIFHLQITQILAIRSLEKQLGASLVDWSRFADRKDNAAAMFLAGFYEEALELLSSDPKYIDEKGAASLRVASLALLGKFDEAEKVMDDAEDRDGLELGVRSLMYFLKGDTIKALAGGFCREQEHIGYLILLMVP